MRSHEGSVAGGLTQGANTRSSFLLPVCTNIRRHTALRCRSQKTAYKSPSSGTASTELEALSRWSTIVPDTLLMQNLQRREVPKAATVTSAVLSGILRNPTGLREYEVAIQRAVGYDKCAFVEGDDRYACELDKALANVGALFAEQVEGHVSTEVDPRLAYDTEGLVARARNIAESYKEMKVERFLVRVPGTWEGIAAAKQLETEGIPVHVTLIYSFAQAAAAAQAGASVIQPNIGRLSDWYKKHPGFVRDPKGPREDSGFSSEINPGIQLVERIYNYCAKLYPKTKVMVSGIRAKKDALLLAGVDFLVVGPKVLESLGKQQTLQGYNDGLSAATNSFEESDLDAKLSSERAAATEFAEEELTQVTKQLFEDGLGQAGLELLQQGVQGLSDDMDRLEGYFKSIAVGSE